MNLLDTYLSKNYTTDKNTIHSYIEKIYNNLFSKLKYDITNFLEIGTESGGSALLWRDFFINATVEMLDIRQCDKILNEERINHIVCDAYSIDTINKLNKYDIIIDDGPHTLPSMIFFVENYINLLKDNGIAIIEDVQSYDWFDQIINKIPSNFDSEIIDLRSVKNRYDDMVLIIQKKII
jgi:hypothetical protein